MKKIILLIFTFYISLSVFSQVIGGLSYEKAYDMLADNGYVYLTGYTNSYGNGNRDGFVVKYNISSGNYEYNTWGKTEYDEFRSISKTNDGFILAGFSFWRDDFGIAAIIAKMNAQLEFEWVNNFGNWHYQHAYKSLVLSTGEFLIGGVDRSISLYGPFLVKISETGDKIWEITYEEYIPSHITDIVELENGNILMLCSKGGFFNPSTIWHDSSHPNADVLFIEINSSGEIIRDKIIEAPHHDIPIKIIPTDDNKFYYLFHSQSYSDNMSFDICLSLVNSDYEIEWIETFGGSSWEYAADMEIDNEGNIHIVGTTNSENQDHPIIIYIKTDSDGAEIETKYLLDTEKGYAASIEIVDSLIFILGTITQDNNDSFVLFKNFDMHDDIDFVPELYIYPNPVQSICNVHNNSRFLINEDVNITIFDINGKQIYNEKSSFSSSSLAIALDFSTYLPGQYFININNSDFSKTMKIMVVR